MPTEGQVPLSGQGGTPLSVVVECCSREDLAGSGPMLWEAVVTTSQEG